MAIEHVSLEVDCKQKKFAISGSPDVVREWFDRLWPQFLGNAAVNDLDADAERGGITDRSQGAAGPAGALPETFGEFYHRFPTDLTDQDRVLLAGYFVQRTSEGNSFSTGAANELLRQQGVRPANPSQSIRRLRDARRVFPVAN